MAMWNSKTHCSGKLWQAQEAWWIFFRDVLARPIHHYLARSRKPFWCFSAKRLTIWRWLNAAMCSIAGWSRLHFIICCYRCLWLTFWWAMTSEIGSKMIHMIQVQKLRSLLHRVGPSLHHHWTFFFLAVLGCHHSHHRELNMVGIGWNWLDLGSNRGQNQHGNKCLGWNQHERSWKIINLTS